jgi:hypothetical protein
MGIVVNRLVSIPSIFLPFFYNGGVFETPWESDKTSRAVIGCTVQAGWVPATVFINEYTFWTGWYPATARLRGPPRHRPLLMVEYLLEITG